jgi:hypothetical protein
MHDPGTTKPTQPVGLDFILVLHLTELSNIHQWLVPD